MKKERKIINEVIKTFNNNIISGLCSIAELYMTDQCEAENAEQECERVLKEAINLDDKNYEVLQLIGSFKISQENKEEAIKYLLQSKDCWALCEEEPPFEVKVNFVKLLLELEQFETSAEILEDLLEENDSDSEIWYLYAFSLLSFDPTEARRSLDKCCELLNKNGIDSQIIIDQVDDLSEKINKAIQNLPEDFEEIIVEEYIDDIDDEENLGSTEMETVEDGQEMEI